MTAYLLLKNSLYIPLVVTVCMWMGGSRTDDDLLRINILAGSGLCRNNAGIRTMTRFVDLSYKIFFLAGNIFKLRIRNELKNLPLETHVKLSVNFTISLYNFLREIQNFIFQKVESKSTV